MDGFQWTLLVMQGNNVLAGFITAREANVTHRTPSTTGGGSSSATRTSTQPSSPKTFLSASSNRRPLGGLSVPASLC